MLVRSPELDTVQAISLVPFSQFAFRKCRLKNGLRGSGWNGICLKQICEEVDGRRRWTEETLFMDDGSVIHLQSFLRPPPPSIHFLTSSLINGICLKQICKDVACEEVDGRRKWTEETLLTEDNLLTICFQQTPIKKLVRGTLERSRAVSNAGGRTNRNWASGSSHVN
jgi:hypothetical protein